MSLEDMGVFLDVLVKDYKSFTAYCKSFTAYYKSFTACFVQLFRLIYITV